LSENRLVEPYRSESMQAPTTQTPPNAPTKEGASGLLQPSRLWQAFGAIALFWVANFIVGRLEKPYFYGFLYAMGSSALLVLVYFAWWWTSRRIRFAERLYGFVLILGTGAVAQSLCHPSIGWFGILMTGLPMVLTVWTLWLLIVRKAALSRTRLGSLVVVSLTWACFTLIRIDGLNASLQPDLRWRWSPSAEGLFLAEKEKAPDNLGLARLSSLERWVPSLAPNDWTGFRGADREGVLRGVRIATDWSTNPPQPLWRQRVGPAWSSVIVIGDHLFTQQQRGDKEAVVCYNALTGEEIWVHEDTARFWEGVSGAGPRATPTFADGRIFTLGGTGLLNCLDAGTGTRCWSRDITADASTKVPLWGLSGSPLVVGGTVVVFSGGEASLRGYQGESGEPAWTAQAGPSSYAAPQLATIDGRPQILMLSDSGLHAFDPATGTKLWEHGLAMPGAPRALQPHVIGETQLVVGTLAGPGVALIEVRRDGDSWKVTQRWASTQLKPEFPDFVVHQGYAYGFDIGIFACIDLATGKRCWKGGRYGRGQVILLADQALLLVVTETGEAVLLAANPRQPEELGRFQAINGKTWNHPVIAHGRLYVRNAEEMACYELPQLPKTVQAVP
jgi:outer membrane protein assembly factor BamB